ncbi:uncharacterized protein N0V89_003489 [Didymosphaeria variabile]|uniref:Uncharacterized protein n=1 Tax=Didymosphaeria variabile TaxID=1932322 RepID=A0A9W8XQD3_9PLEO|nr:uncharacterized protein N0V89_003489 [Didymosphaeria variabile]KAJ4355473.1 hypothetical protein N0V89_003489 [Didymosphaeria variabile]
MATSIILGAAGLAVTVLDIASFLQSLGGTPDPLKQTQVTLVVGNAPNSEGSMPDIYAKGPFGFQLAHTSDKSLFKDGHLEGSQAKTFIIDNDPGIDFQTQVHQPQYVSVVMTQGDAICLSAVIANGDGATYTWTGDMGAQCGAEWYESDFAFGNSNVPPKCVWLDSDHSNDIVASAVSMHMTDFAGPLLPQYQETNEAGDNIGDARLCKNSARMTFYHDFKYENWAVFEQPLKFNGSGAFEEPDLGIDREKRAYPDGVRVLLTARANH